MLSAAVLARQITNSKKMKKSQGRDTTGLGTPEESEAAFEAIVRYFSEPYLNARGRHRMQMLWQRKDRLSTVELYTLGLCLLKFDSTNEKWLKDTIRRIKKEPAAANGLLSEIIFFGFFGMHHSKLIPAKEKQPGYDFHTELPNGVRNYITVKNIDASDRFKAFKTASKRLRAKWIERLKLRNDSFTLRVIANRLLEESDFEEVIQYMQGVGTLHPHSVRNGSDDFSMILSTVGESSQDLSPIHSSDRFLVACPGHSNEETRYRKKLMDAIENITRNVPFAPKVLRTVFLRLHANCDYRSVAEIAKRAVDDALVDLVICYQPSYCRDAAGSSVLHHCFKIEVNPRFAVESQGLDYFKATIPVGTVSQEPSKVVIPGADGQIEIPSSHYIFQQGDIYLLTKHHPDGSQTSVDLGSPATGIRTHSVAKIDNQYVTITPKQHQLEDDLLIV